MSKIAVVGLGYVGLPLALRLAKERVVIGYDIHVDKVASYNNMIDPSGECGFADFEQVSSSITFTNDSSRLSGCEIIIVTVPTPVDSANSPDFSPLVKSCEVISQHLRKGDLVIFESTVYPGATEEICIPILEAKSGLKHLDDFNVGYSPERINPGDKERNLEDVTKVISADTKEALSRVERVYAPIIHAGLHKAPSIKVAEAAKVLENTQRDINIALMNEMSMICERIGISTLDVIDAASTKWNFLRFSPGLVGGHCIGVDPYYLTHKAARLGYHSEVILAGRRINDSMASAVASRVVKKIYTDGGGSSQKRVLILGLSFKENVSDTRNSKVFDVLQALGEYNLSLDVFDPLTEKMSSSNAKWLPRLNNSVKYDCVLLAAGHDEFCTMESKQILEFLNEKTGFIMDIKGWWREMLEQELGDRYMTL